MHDSSCLFATTTGRAYGIAV